jgi:phospholipid/cholesterol/gamma-HCH transport system substrate-binding protein
MSTRSNHFKLGLFVLVAIAGVLATAGALGARSAQQETVTYHTYFNESVQGLELGSPVKFRGVTIGVVEAIEIAPDHRHVDVVAQLSVDDIRRMGLSEDSPGGGQVRFVVPADLRAQLGSQGITGVKFVLIDFFDPASNPPPELPFPTPENYIPAASSLFKNLEDSVVKAVDRFPEVADSIVAITARIDAILREFQDRQGLEKAVAMLENANLAVNEMRGVLQRFDKAGVPDRAAKTIDNLDRAVTKMHTVLDGVGGDAGLLASAQRATNAFGDFGVSAHGATDEFTTALRDLSAAARSIRELAEALERDPDMLLKGRKKEAP